MEHFGDALGEGMKRSMDRYLHEFSRYLMHQLAQWVREGKTVAEGEAEAAHTVDLDSQDGLIHRWVLSGPEDSEVNAHTIAALKETLGDVEASYDAVHNQTVLTIRDAAAYQKVFEAAGVTDEELRKEGLPEARIHEVMLDPYATSQSAVIGSPELGEKMLAKVELAVPSDDPAATDLAVALKEAGVHGTLNPGKDGRALIAIHDSEEGRKLFLDHGIGQLVDDPENPRQKVVDVPRSKDGLADGVELARALRRSGELHDWKLDNQLTPEADVLPLVQLGHEMGSASSEHLEGSLIDVLGDAGIPCHLEDTGDGRVTVSIVDDPQGRAFLASRGVKPSLMDKPNMVEERLQERGTLAALPVTEEAGVPVASFDGKLEESDPRVQRVAHALADSNVEARVRQVAERAEEGQEAQARTVVYADDCPALRGFLARHGATVEDARETGEAPGAPNGIHRALERDGVVMDAKRLDDNGNLVVAEAAQRTRGNWTEYDRCARWLNDQGAKAHAIEEKGLSRLSVEDTPKGREVLAQAGVPWEAAIANPGAIEAALRANGALCEPPALAPEGKIAVARIMGNAEPGHDPAQVLARAAEEGRVPSAKELSPELARLDAFFRDSGGQVYYDSERDVVTYGIANNRESRAALEALGIDHRMLAQEGAAQEVLASMGLCPEREPQVDVNLSHRTPSEKAQAAREAAQGPSEPSKKATRVPEDQKAKSAPEKGHEGPQRSIGDEGRAPSEPAVPEKASTPQVKPRRRGLLRPVKSQEDLEHVTVVKTNHCDPITGCGEIGPSYVSSSPGACAMTQQKLDSMPEGLQEVMDEEQSRQHNAEERDRYEREGGSGFLADHQANCQRLREAESQQQAIRTMADRSDQAQER